MIFFIIMIEFLILKMNNNSKKLLFFQILKTHPISYIKKRILMLRMNLKYLKLSWNIFKRLLISNIVNVILTILMFVYKTMNF